MQELKASSLLPLYKQNVDTTREKLTKTRNLVAKDSSLSQMGIHSKERSWPISFTAMADSLTRKE